jgi:DNA-binding PadR family transcriptional regulator
MTPPTTPLSATDFHVLLVLTEGDLYGYAIMKAVEAQSGGRVSPEIGSLYRVLARLMAIGMVTEVDGPSEGGTHRGRPRKYYAITPQGREAARAEAARLSELVELARGRDLLPGRTAY